MSPSSKVFTVMGAGSGIGRATAHLLASRGAALCLADISETGLQETKSQLQSQGHQNVAIFPLDVLKREHVRDFYEETRRKFGKLDGCANIAGTVGDNMLTHAIWEHGSDTFRTVMGVNAEGVFNCLAEALRPGVLEKNGSIVNMASTAGLRGFAKCTPYVASKHAVVGLTRAAAMDAGPLGIRVNVVAPGFIHTPLLYRALQAGPEDLPVVSTPIARYGQPEEVAAVVGFLLSDESAFVTGAVYTVDGGQDI